MINFETLGYKNITKDNPIHFVECLGGFFESVYPYSQRFYKKENAIEIELKVGNIHSLVLIAGICYYSKGWEKFEVNAPEDYIDKMFTQTLDAVKLKIKENIIKY